MASEQCGNRNKFCFVCGKFTPSNREYSRPIYESVKKAYEICFKMPLVQNWYTPDIVCLYCRISLERNNIKYTLSMQWLPRSQHSDKECYFCSNAKKTQHLNYKTRHQVEYVIGDSVIEPVTQPKTSRRALAQGTDEYILKIIVIMMHLFKYHTIFFS